VLRIVRAVPATLRFHLRQTDSRVTDCSSWCWELHPPSPWLNPTQLALYVFVNLTKLTLRRRSTAAVARLVALQQPRHQLTT
jgi:hypothetical protein